MTPAEQPDYKRILQEASRYLLGFAGHTSDVIEVSKPPDLDYALHLSKIISKLSPMLGNILEYRAVSQLNERGGWPKGKWKRQDPDFPDTIFVGDIQPAPGIEIKTWFPLATEITARFKDSITHFLQDQTNVAMLAWIPQNVIFGKPYILDVWVDSALSVAIARDTHYHNPPDYLVFEPEDTSARTRNLQQRNTNGYKFQGTPAQFAKARKIVASWGPDGKTFSHALEYQAQLRTLLGKFPYRLDTNFAKMDRIKHETLETFKTRVLDRIVKGHTVRQWDAILRGTEQPENTAIIKQLCGL